MDDANRSQIDWDHLSRDWPELIYLRKVGELPNFPWSAKYFRNLCCGRGARPELKNAVIQVAGFAAMKKPVLVRFMLGLCRGCE